MDSHFRFDLLRSPEALDASFALRFQVYCEERGFLPLAHYPLGLESDAYDARAIHVGAFDTEGALVATVRLIRGPLAELPIALRCFIDTDTLPADAQGIAAAEISRLAVSRRYRRRVTDSILPELLDDGSPAITGTQRRSRSELVLGLYRGMYQASKREGIRYWFAAMEKSLFRLLQRLDFEFLPIGPEIDYHGPVTPHLIAIDEIEQRLAACNPELLREMARGLPAALQPLALAAACGREPSPEAGTSAGDPAEGRGAGLEGGRLHRAPLPMLAE